MTFRAVVVEDSRLAREGLVRMLEAFPERLQVLGQAAEAATALALIERERPDLLFLDIHLPGGTGFDLLGQLSYTPYVVFTTAHSDQAIRSFDFNTVDYLLKPISPARLARALDKLKALPEAPEEADPEPTGEAKPPLELDSRIFIKDGGRCHLVPLASIRYLESCKNYVRVFFGKDQSAFVKRSLNAVEARLPRQAFFRANRQHIVNLQAIRTITETVSDGYELTMDDGRKLEISRRNAAELKDLLSL